MNLELNGKKALVTGSTAGIGFAIAERLLNEGASVIVNGRTEGRVAQAIHSLNERGLESVTGFVGDLSQSGVRQILLREIPEVDILINNLGVFEARELTELQESDWQHMFDFNVLSGAVLSQHYIKKMKSKNWGRIIFIASETGVNIPPDMIHYGVSKAAQIALARGIAETTKGTRVTVNSVLPGPTLSEGVGKFLESIDADQHVFIQTLRPTSLIQRFATADEVANLVAYLSSPLAAATNGAAMRVEGGLLR